MVKIFSITDLLLDLAQDVRTGIENCPERYKLAYSVPCWNSFPPSCQTSIPSVTIALTSPRVPTNLTAL